MQKMQKFKGPQPAASAPTADPSLDALAVKLDSSRHSAKKSVDPLDSMALRLRSGRTLEKSHVSPCLFVVSAVDVAVTGPDSTLPLRWLLLLSFKYFEVDVLQDHIVQILLSVVLERDKSRTRVLKFLF